MGLSQSTPDIYYKYSIDGETLKGSVNNVKENRLEAVWYLPTIKNHIEKGDILIEIWDKDVGGKHCRPSAGILDALFASLRDLEFCNPDDLIGRTNIDIGINDRDQKYGYGEWTNLNGLGAGRVGSNSAVKLDCTFLWK